MEIWLVQYGSHIEGAYEYAEDAFKRVKDLGSHYFVEGPIVVQPKLHYKGGKDEAAL